MVTSSLDYKTFTVSFGPEQEEPPRDFLGKMRNICEFLSSRISCCFR